jgi:hypothetical protein
MSFFSRGDNDEDDDISLGSMLFGPKEGSWWLESKSDPRWNCSGRAFLMFTAGMPQEVQNAIGEKKAIYGEAPADLEWGGMKD